MVGNIAVVSGGVLEENSERNLMAVHERKKLKITVGEEGEQLLPGLPNDLTFDQVAPKLPWTAFHALSSVSCGWRQAIQHHDVYDARVHSKATQTLVAMKHRVDDHLSKLVLYSVKDGSCYHLPPIPGLQQIPEECTCISLDGKLYLLGGFMESTPAQASASVFVLDVVGQRQWKQCASMAVPRAGSGCGVFDGKIYVFGGSAKPMSCHIGDVYLSGSEVYDPKEDTWSPIMPMTSARATQRVTNVGQELFLYDGWYSSPNSMGTVCSAEAYHPLKDEWRTVEGFDRSSNPAEKPSPVMVGGELHMVNSLGLHIYDRHAKSWTLSKSFSFSGITSEDAQWVALFAVVIVDDVLLVNVSSFWFDDVEDCHMISQIIGEDSKEMVFQKAQCPSSPIMCLIEL